MAFGSGVIPPVQFEKAMIFVDGTNLFYRLASEKLRLERSIRAIFSEHISRRTLVRTYLYTVKENLEKAVLIHGEHIRRDVRVVLGDGIPTKDGNIKEKGVDALLVADMVYHAATRNYDFALVVSSDTDFVQAIRRVEDFGCRTGVLCVCSDVPPRLKESSDLAFSLTGQMLVEGKHASRIQN
ncbi:MAG: NYN domain-containing protein [Elusimicrobiota bacterium]|jgi:uncharacterized LabA/DUF88 family protein